MKKDLNPETAIVEAGFSPDQAMKSVKTPIYMTSTFAFDSAEDGEQFFKDFGAGKKTGFIYSRFNNPNLDVLEARLKVFDGAEAAAAFSSGMSAIATSVLALNQPDSYMIYCSPVYGGTEVLFEKYLPSLGIRCVSLHAGDEAEEKIRSIINEEGKAPFMVFMETPANPSMEMTDIEAVVRAVKSRDDSATNSVVAIDNTFLGPIFQKPIAFGVDLVIYSTTKFICGHSDMVGGAAMGREDLLTKIKSWRAALGTTMSPYNAWLATRSLETLDMRMRRCTENAQQLASLLEGHDKVHKVYYPDFYPVGSKQRKIFEKQCSGSGAIISFDLASKENAFSFLNKLEVFTLAVSLGSNESLAEHPATHTHSGIPKEDRIKVGIGDSMVRLSVGVEHIDDLKKDVLQALDK